MLKKLISEYVYQNKKIVVGLFVCITIGVISGLAIYLLSNNNVKDRISSQMNESIKLSDNGEYIKTEIIYNGIRNNVVYILIMFGLSIMLYGSLFIYLLYVLKGISIGIYIATLFNIFGFWWGLLVIGLLVVLVNIVYLPAIVFVGAQLINYNLDIMEYRNESKKVINFSKVIFNILMGLLVIFSSIIVEQLMSNVAIKISDFL